MQVGVWIEAGSRHETTANNGVARLLERLAFKVFTFAGHLTRLLAFYFMSLEAIRIVLHIVSHCAPEFTYLANIFTLFFHFHLKCDFPHKFVFRSVMVS